MHLRAVHKTSVLLTGVLATFLLSACGTALSPGSTTTSPTPGTTDLQGTELSGVKTYLLDRAGKLVSSSEELQTDASRYYDLAKAANFDYAKLWNSSQGEVKKNLEQARQHWMAASPLYEQMEGIVAGVSTLSQYDVILDAGSSGAEGGDNVVPFDLTLPDGRVLAKPGNLFGVTESTLWGTFKDYTAQGVQPDFNDNGQVDLGDALPDANVLKAGSEALHRYSSELQQAATNWQPTPVEAFNALVVMIPTMNEYFESWKNSRFVAGSTSEQRDFVAISRLNDIVDILSGLEVVYQGVSPGVQAKDADRDSQISSGLEDLKAFVDDVRTKEQAGKRFTPEEADLLGAEAQNRATTIVGQVSQAAALLNIPIEEQ